MPRIIVKTGYIKGKAHKEYYVRYIATRDGVEKYRSDHGDKPATKKQKMLIKQLMSDYPDAKAMFEYDDYKNDPTRENASELISSVIDSNIHDVCTKENYVDYIANRPRVEKLGEHGLFSDHGYTVDLTKTVRKIGEHEGNVWTHIISLKREDASRLGYDNVHSWIGLCQSKRNELAEAMKISPDHLKWYAAFHNEGHHPHIHMVVYSDDIKEGFVTKKGIDKIRGMFAKEIFKQDLIQIYSKQTETRDEIKKYSQETVEKLLKGLEVSHVDNDYIFQKIMELKTSLNDYHGRYVYAYIPKKSKQIINDILREMEKNSHLKQLYDQWLLYRQDIQSTYKDTLMEKLPLLEQKEFKSIKNMILNEVMNFQYDDIDLPIDNEQKEYILDDLFTDQCEDAEDVSYVDDRVQYKMEWSKKYRLAVRCFYGDDQMKQDMEHAKLLLKEECQQNNVLACALLGKLYDAKNEDDKSYEMYSQALKGFEEISSNSQDDKNDFIRSYTSYRIGRHYLYGMGTETDYKKAFEYFCESDSQYAQYSLGKMYQRGLGTDKDDAMAFQYFYESAKQNNVFACYEVARHYELGRGCVQDLQKADMYYHKAYQQFESMIQKRQDDNLLYRLGMMTFKGKGCQQNTELAELYLEKVAGLNNENAKVLLSQIYLENDEFEYFDKSVRWLMESKSPTAFYVLGREYHTGNHLEKDLNKAVHYLEKCEDNEYAYYRLYQIYKEAGHHDKSIDCLKKACDRGYDPALVKMAQYMINGEKVPKDIGRAIEYLKIADKHNNEFAQYMLGRLFLFGKDVEKDKEAALEYLTKSAVQGNEFARYLLEHMDDVYHQSLALLTSRFFYHVSQIFRQQIPVNANPLYGVDRKLKLKIMKKKIAMGHRHDDHTLHS